ncbi:hypothetical protein ElyMa_004243600 [Elysia marginata]|uniref:Domain of unknown function with conserved HDNR motif domain-containing protein n=1 Tax=Elysia marginata TaxID=1093978 RepID=A0AAV4GSH7_9GAST|nr:hypothetical protein ElyMa_004243600 [Elysia marginata]
METRGAEASPILSGRLSRSSCKCTEEKGQNEQEQGSIDYTKQAFYRFSHPVTTLQCPPRWLGTQEKTHSRDTEFDTLERFYKSKPFVTSSSGLYRNAAMGYTVEKQLKSNHTFSQPAGYENGVKDSNQMMPHLVAPRVQWHNDSITNRGSHSCPVLQVCR